MSGLTDRLRGIVQPRGGLSTGARLGGVPGLSPASTGATNVEDALGGRWTSEHRTFVVERRVRADRTYGRARVAALADELERAAADPSLVALVTGQPAGPAPFLFFDLETTGLSGGAGTHAFLVGAAWFDGGDFVTRQHLLVDYGAERPMLDEVRRDFERAGSLVSFNGKSFDAPLLDTRYLFHRLEWPGAGTPHVDALHPARRFWRQTAYGARESCSLVALEEEILGARRHGDVPGFEIPARYFNFVRSGDAGPLEAVFEHNRLDLLSLAGLTARLIALVADGPEAASTAWEALAIGRAYARSGQADRACAAFEKAVSMTEGRGPLAEAPKVDALRALAILERRARRYTEAADAWRRLLQVPSCPAMIAREANEALAIHHEHRVRDLEAAKMFALESLENGGGDSGWSDAVQHRLQRIERKMAPLSARPLFSPSPSLP